MLTNVMSRFPKIVDDTVFLVRNKINLVLITETWLKDTVPNSVINVQILPYYVRIRHRKFMCVLTLKNHYEYTRLNDFNCCDNHECLWVYLTPIPAKMYIYSGNVSSTWFRWNIITSRSSFHTLTLLESKYPVWEWTFPLLHEI